MFEAVLFDLYDTLAYIEIEDYLRTKAQMAAEAGVPADAFVAQWKQYTRPAARGEVLTTEERAARVLRDLGVDPTRQLIHRLSQLELDLQEQQVHLFPDTREVLMRLKNKGLKLGLVTNASLSTREVPKILSIRTLFDTVVFSYAIGVRKPDPEIYLTACKRLTVLPSACLFVGDGNDRELDGAREVGMCTVMVGTKRDELVRAEQGILCDYCIQTLSELIPIVETCLRRPFGI
ncbi:MAG: HAD family hydrolase [Anaerolineae bacterium]